MTAVNDRGMTCKKANCGADSHVNTVSYMTSGGINPRFSNTKDSFKDSSSDSSKGSSVKDELVKVF